MVNSISVSHVFVDRNLHFSHSVVYYIFLSYVIGYTGGLDWQWDLLNPY
jgi:hypothetical protein